MGKIPTIITIASRGAAQWLRVCLVAGLAAYLFSNSSGALADAEHLTIQAMPIELGTSGASVEDLYVNACCTAGTLGALVVDELGGLDRAFALARDAAGLPSDAAHQVQVFPERPDPIEQLRVWIGQAEETDLPNPAAMSLATVDSDGRPSTRIVLLRSAGLMFTL